MGGGKGCAVVGCSSSSVADKHKHFYKFPKDDSYRDVWLTFTRRGSDYEVRNSSCICEQHFDPSRFVYKRKQQCLAMDSVPTIFYRDTPRGTQRIVLTFDRDVLHYVEEETLLSPAFDKEKREMELVQKQQRKLKAVKNSCRFCFDEQDSTIISIDKLKDYGISPSEMLGLVGINTEYNEVFSKNICEECFQQVISIDGFRKRCQKAQNGVIAALKDTDDQVQKIRNTVGEPDSWFKPETNWDQDDAIDDFMSPSINLEIKAEKNEIENHNFQQIILKEEMEKSEKSDDATSDSDFLSPKYKTKGNKNKRKKRLKKASTGELTGDASSVEIEQTVQESKHNRSQNIRDYECFYCHEKCRGHIDFKHHKCNAKLTCEVQGCGKIFTKLSGFNMHISCVHKLPRLARLYCATCRLSSVMTQEDFKEHSRLCEKSADKRVAETSVTCEACNKVCPTQKSFSVHAMFHKVSEPFVPSTFKWKVKRGVFICETCGKEFATNYYLIDHVKRMHKKPDENPTIYYCDHCGTSRTSKIYLKKHIQNVHLVALAPCNFCSKVFRNKTLLNKHMIYHKESKRIHVCPFCPDRLPFFTANSLKQHSEAHHGYGNGYQCPICMSTYKTRSALSQHKIAFHSNRMPRRKPKPLKETMVYSESTSSLIFS